MHSHTIRSNPGYLTSLINLDYVIILVIEGHTTVEVSLHSISMLIEARLPTVDVTNLVTVSIKPQKFPFHLPHLEAILVES
jgi:hypothetical protein